MSVFNRFFRDVKAELPTTKYEVIKHEPLQWSEDERMLFTLLTEAEKHEFAYQYFITKATAVIYPNTKGVLIHG